jgi:hypothetical protein
MFYWRHSESWMDKFSYREAGRQLLIMAFLHRIVNSGGNVERQMATGRRRVDLCVYFYDRKILIIFELKSLQVISWEERINREEINREWRGYTRHVNLFEM